MATRCSRILSKLNIGDLLLGLAAFVSYLIVDGSSLAFGVIYPEIVLYFESSRAIAAFVPSLLWALPMILSPFTCASIAYFGSRPTALGGAIITCLGFFVGQFTTSIGTLIFVCIIIGGGQAMLYDATYLMIANKFDERRGFIIGIVLSGGAIGSMVFAMLFVYLLEEFAWQGAFIWLAAFHIQLCVVCMVYVDEPTGDGSTETNSSSEDSEEVNVKISKDVNSEEVTFRSLPQLTYERRRMTLDHAEPHAPIPMYRTRPLVLSKFSSVPDMLIHSREHEKKTPDAFDGIRRALHSQRHICSHPEFIIFLISTFLTSMWMAAPNSYLPDAIQSAEGGTSDSEDFSALVIIVMGIASVFGTIFTGWFGDLKFALSVIVYGLLTSIAGVALLLIPLTMQSRVALCAVCALFAFINSASYTLLANVLVDIIVNGKDHLIGSYALVQMLQGFAVIAGGYISGLVFDELGSYDLMFLLAGALVIFSNLILFIMPAYRWFRQLRTDVQ